MQAISFAPSNLSGVGGTHWERIHSVQLWKGRPVCQDYVFVSKDLESPGFKGLHAACIFLFFQFQYKNVEYPCALVHWFSEGMVLVIPQECGLLNLIWTTKEDKSWM
ncbi:hypothetical protein BT96DRAFT_824984 [Gymnopus androsaceus JB14]|uniref:Uncharacterized protein n=1 Tax=Gymnopus androsaceus JB14 TaxID=1447944 RepID=A0A6A4HD10_9AGAR|nr:hypothetical protein BT96DRAFT_824984 [Gymnopus androsaceus JB14]